MSAQDETAAPDAPGETEASQEEATEQTSSAGTSYGEELLKLAVEEGHAIGLEPPKAEEEKPEAEPEPEAEAEAPEAEKEPEPKEEEPKEEEEKPAEEKVHKGEPWPQSAKARVAEETGKKNRANERAERAEARAAELEARLAQAVAPAPTETDPFIDVNDIYALDKLERSYEKAIDLADENPEGAEGVVIGKKADGTEDRRDFTPEELTVMRRKAEKAIRKFIPERRTYLQQRAQADAETLKLYPELKQGDSEFTQTAAFLANQITTGQAIKAPDLLVWIARAVKGYEAERARNGESAVSPAEAQILKAAKQRIAPTPTRTRSVPERAPRGSDMVKAEKELEEKGTPEAAEKYVAALFSKSAAGAKRLERIAE